MRHNDNANIPTPKCGSATVEPALRQRHWEVRLTGAVRTAA